jgi:hypothetical protein
VNASIDSKEQVLIDRSERVQTYLNVSPQAVGAVAAVAVDCGVSIAALLRRQTPRWR